MAFLITALCKLHTMAFGKMSSQSKKRRYVKELNAILSFVWALGYCLETITANKIVYMGIATLFSLVLKVEIKSKDGLRWFLLRWDIWSTVVPIKH